MRTFSSETKLFLNVKLRYFLFLFLLSIISSCELFEEGDDDDETPIAISQIQGDWIRINSNNSSNDFMQIKVTGTNGVISFPASSGFADGAVKWQNISPANATSYTHEELGSDGNYYDGTITVLNDSTVNIAVANSGAGNNQTWVRNNGQYDSEIASSQELDNNFFSQDRVLKNTSAPVDYIISSVMDISDATITIEPGVVIEFKANAGIGVYDNGALKAQGTAGEPIIFRGEQQVRGFWRGIHIESNSLDNVLSHIKISDAGSNYVYCCNEVATVFLKGGSLTYNHVELSNGGSVGFRVTGDNATLREVSNNTFTNHTKYPVSGIIEKIAQIVETTSDFSGNLENYIFIENSDVKNDISLKKGNVPYLIETGVIDVTRKLTIDAGVQIFMEEDAGIGVFDEGALTIDGTSTEPVVMKGIQNVQGYWRGIHIESNSIDNKLTHAIISNAGSNYVYCCNVVATIFLKDGKAALSNLVLESGAGIGIYAGKDVQLDNFEKIQITTHQKYPMSVAIEVAGKLDGLASTYVGNDDNYINIYRSSVEKATVLPENDIPYLIESVIDIRGDKLTINAGATLVFNEDAGLGIYDNGKLNAVGTADKKITFRGREALQGYWRGIHTETNSFENKLSYVDLMHAGGNYVYCCNEAAALFVKSGMMEVDNSLVQDSGGCGISVRSGATLVESGNTFSNNADGHICN